MNAQERHALNQLVDMVLARLGVARASLVPELIADIEEQIQLGGVNHAVLYFTHSPKRVRQ
jgi:hypothetical protein